MRVKPARGEGEGAWNARGQRASAVLQRAGNRNSLVAGMEKPSSNAVTSQSDLRAVALDGPVQPLGSLPCRGLGRHSGRELARRRHGPPYPPDAWPGAVTSPRSRLAQAVTYETVQGNQRKRNQRFIDTASTCERPPRAGARPRLSRTRPGADVLEAGVPAEWRRAASPAPNPFPARPQERNNFLIFWVARHESSKGVPPNPLVKSESFFVPVPSLPVPIPPLIHLAAVARYGIP